MFMRFGVGFSPRPASAEQSASVWFDSLLRLACRADEFGYEHVQVVELPLSVDDGPGLDPVPLLSAVSVLTVGIRVGVAAMAPDRTHALELADRLTILDNLSHGRLDVSFHQADLPARPWPLRTSRQASRDRFADGVDICRRLWSGHWTGSEPGSTSGRSYQSPHPPIFVASATSAAACAGVGRAGYHLHLVPAAISPVELRDMLTAYRAGRSAAGLEPGRVRLSYNCYLAEDDQSAQITAQRVEPPLPSAAGATASRSPAIFAGRGRLADGGPRPDYDRAYAENRILAGSPARIRDQIAGIADTLGEDVSLQVNLARMPRAGTERALQLFAEQVMPYFSGDPDFSGDPADAWQEA
jgi:alkanesulfonate monooxygenase SsuD/methylene tetrahydromethanopterin reductase-like flavin-dependent oxidoreductase (luciferase family)